MFAIRILAVFCLGALASAQAPLFSLLDHGHPTDIQAGADLDADGDWDLLVSDGVMLNDGHGRFTRIAVPSLAFPRHVTKLADLTSDGLPDVITLTYSPVPVVTTYRRIGSGFVLLQPLLLAPLGPNLIPRDFEPGDVDGDGDLDLVMTVSSTSLVPAPPLFWVNDGTGNLTAGPAVPVPVASQTVRLVDLDGDGDLDAVFADRNLGGASGIFTAINYGTGFTLTPAPAWAGVYVSFDLGDFDNDALPDLVVSLVGSAAIVLNSPAGFVPPVVSVRPGPGAIVAALDLNADGIDDVLESTSFPSFLTVTTMLPAGAFGPTPQTWNDLKLWTAFALDPQVHDLDGDGDDDLVAFRDGEAVMLMNVGIGTFARIGGRVTDVEFNSAPKVGDLDGDGDADVLGLHWGPYVTTGLNDGDGLITPGPVSALNFGGMTYTLHLFDRDGDGDLDLYSAFHSQGSSGPPPVSDVVYDNHGASFIQVATAPNLGDARGSRAADFDADGDQDLVFPPSPIATTPSPTLYVASLGAAGLAAPAPLGGPHFTNDLDLGDFDGNGTIDVFQTNSQGFGPNPDFCVVYLGNGAGSFTAVTVPGLSGFFTASGDLNGDGMTDVVVDGQVWLSTGAGGFAAGPALPQPLAASATLADVDLDGDLDLVETPANVMINTGSGFAPPQSYLTINVPPSAIEIFETTVVDLDRDGDPDLVLPGPVVLTNTTRHVAIGSVPRVGRPASIDLYGSPGGAWFLFGSNGTTSFPFPPWGVVLIDPASAQLLASGTYPAVASPLAGKASFGGTLPNNPALIGWTTYWQSIDASQMRFTNRVTVTVMGY
jgi:hypothetical protein